eukprot:275422-Chlamydomonas_euryale.AAC.1
MVALRDAAATTGGVHTAGVVWHGGVGCEESSTTPQVEVGVACSLQEEECALCAQACSLQEEECALCAVTSPVSPLPRRDAGSVKHGVGAGDARPHGRPVLHRVAAAGCSAAPARVLAAGAPVSYTHLTLPTILLV